MSALHSIKLLLRHSSWLILTPLICATTVFLLTRHTKKQYVSSTTLYTGVASGYSITSTADERLDYFAVNNAFDNLLASAKSRETIEQVALHLLAEHLLLNKPDPKILSTAGFENLKLLAGNDLFEKARKLGDAQSVYNYLNQVNSSKVNNEISRALNQPGSFYNIDDLKSNLTVSRINTSDILQVVYSCADPAVCQRTLELHSAIFTSNYKRLKADQTFSAVQYFESKLADVKSKLQLSEDNLKEFGQQNRIINYYEQTRYIAESKEQLNKDIYTQKVAKDGSQKALTLVEKKLNSREKQIINSTDVINIRQRLSEVNAALERAKIYANPEKIAALSQRSKQLEDSISVVSNQYNNLNYTLETVPRSGLVQEWINNAVSADKASAGIGVLNDQKKSYLGEFDKFAPLGSTLKRLDRQVDINEKEYLSILNGLNLARLRQSNLALSSNIVIQDKPFFPLKAQASTQKLLVLASFFAAFILVVSIVLGWEFMNSSIRSAERAKKIINLPLAGISIADSNSKPLLYQQPLRSLLTEQLISIMLPFISTAVEAKGKAQVSLITTRNDVYNNHDIKLLHELFSSVFSSIYWIVPDSYAAIFNTALPVNTFGVYTPGIIQLNYKKVNDLVGKDLSAYKLIFYLSPNLSQNSLPGGIAKSSDINMLVFNASDTWRLADREILTRLRTTTPDIPFYIWLVNTNETYLDSIIGEIPKDRSRLRNKVKKALTLNLT
jgi:succinoglycan biosynthesis transport protein ExoP